MSWNSGDPSEWVRSSGCVDDHHCVEVARSAAGVRMRSSTRPEVVLEFTPDQWRRFIRELQR